MDYNNSINRKFQQPKERCLSDFWIMLMKIIVIALNNEEFQEQHVIKLLSLLRCKINRNVSNARVRISNKKIKLWPYTREAKIKIDFDCAFDLDYQLYYPLLTSLSISLLSPSFLISLSISLSPTFLTSLLISLFPSPTLQAKSTKQNPPNKIQQMNCRDILIQSIFNYELQYFQATTKNY